MHLCSTPHHIVFGLTDSMATILEVAAKTSNLSVGGCGRDDDSLEFYKMRVALSSSPRNQDLIIL